MIFHESIDFHALGHTRSERTVAAGIAARTRSVSATVVGSGEGSSRLTARDGSASVNGGSVASNSH